MISIFTYVGYFCMAVLLIVAFAVISFLVQYTVWFHWRNCKHCGHVLKYRGLKEDGKGGYHLFHCPKCDNWESVPREEFFKYIDNGMEDK